MGNALVIGVLVGLALLLVVAAVIATSKERKKIVPDYRAMFVLGLVFLPIGLAGGNPGLWGMGLAFLLAGLVNKDKWGKQTKWADYPPRFKKIKLIAVIGLATLLLAAVAFFVFSNANP